MTIDRQRPGWISMLLCWTPVSLMPIAGIAVQRSLMRSTPQASVMAPMKTTQTMPVRLGWTFRVRPAEPLDFVDGFRAKVGPLRVGNGSGNRP